MNAATIAANAEECARIVGEGKPKAKTGRRAMSRATVAGLVMAANAMRVSKDWSRATPGHLVALWAWCHEQVYGVAPEEAGSPAQFGRACMRAGQLVKASFGGNVAQAVEFMRWSWAREKRRHAWRVREGQELRRVGWALQFSSTLVGDWRVETAGRSKIPGK